MLYWNFPPFIYTDGNGLATGIFFRNEQSRSRKAGNLTRWLEIKGGHKGYRNVLNQMEWFNTTEGLLKAEEVDGIIPVFEHLKDLTRTR